MVDSVMTCFFDVRGGAHPVFDALGSARQPFFSLLAQRKEGKRKGTPRLGLRCAPTSLRSSAKTGAAELAPFGRSDSPRFSRFCPAVLGCTKGRGRSVAESLHLGPVDAAEHHSRFREQARACLSGRRPRVHARRKGREAQGTPCVSKGQVVGGLFLWFVSFGQAKEMNAGVRRRAHQKHPVRQREQNQGCAPPSAVPFRAASPRPPETPSHRPPHRRPGSPRDRYGRAGHGNS